jgi:type II secretory ATPase GspE/PulE/Tfp pilus assembly ATPase PilB-like protein
MRILDNRSINVSLDDLGFSENVLTIWKSMIDQPHGIVLVTGPTGSGKTTTLYSSLRCMDGNKLNISTGRGPDRVPPAQANQVQVHDKIGMTFAAALRSLLRQDPDVVLLGEIRDTETANIAVQASLTGHLVLSTLHTNDAPGVDHAADQHRRRAVPDQLGRQRDPGAAAGPQDLPELPRAVRPQRRNARVP